MKPLNFREALKVYLNSVDKDFTTLALALDMNVSNFSKKLNERGSARFTNQELKKIAQQLIEWGAGDEQQVNDLFELREPLIAFDQQIFPSRYSNNRDALDKRQNQTDDSNRKLGFLPKLPATLVGRDEDFTRIRRLLKQKDQNNLSGSRLIALRGWPGVGKSTMAAALAHDSEVLDIFPDGILWASLGHKPKVFDELMIWGRALGANLSACKTVEELSGRLTWILRDKRILLIIDDVWEIQDVKPFLIGGTKCSAIFTTRSKSLAFDLVSNPQYVYTLDVLTPEKSFELFRILAPEVAKVYFSETNKLLKEIEYLPLAIQVAARLLHLETSRGLQIETLIKELQEGSKLLQAYSPSELEKNTKSTVAILLRKSTDYLDPVYRYNFALLGSFASKPAKFSVNIMEILWKRGNISRQGAEVDFDAIRCALVDRGILEFVGGTYYTMHALLVLHAKDLLREQDTKEHE
jgi:hypothetical protein